MNREPMQKVCRLNPLTLRVLTNFFIPNGGTNQICNTKTRRTEKIDK